MRIAIIGGGWAGLACAEKLLACRQDQRLPNTTQVTLFESAPTLGGRARGLTWHIDDRQSIAIDNGQHLTIGAYTETFALLARSGAPDWPSAPLQWSGVTHSGRIAYRWPISSAAWPWRGLAMLMPAYAAKGWPWSWKASLGATLLSLMRTSWQPDTPTQTVSQWLTQRDVPQGLIEHFWQPLIESALNTAIHEASARVAMAVLKDSIAGPAGATLVRMPPSDLTTDGVDPIAKALIANGLCVLTGHRVTRLDGSGHLEVRKSDTVSREAFDAVVMALDHHASLKLWQDSRLAMTAAQKRWQTLESRAITTVWVALNQQSIRQLSRLPPWFVLHPISGVPRIAQVAVIRSNAMALVISAQDAQAAIDAKRQEKDLIDQIRAQLSVDISALPRKWITEKMATWACTASAPAADDAQAAGLTGLDRIFRAADDLHASYPATIESAVRSGQRTALTVVDRLGCVKPAL